MRNHQSPPPSPSPDSIFKRDALAPPTHTFNLPQVNLVAEERTVKGSYIGTCVPTRDIPRYIELYRRGKLPVDRLMSSHLTLDDINLGFDLLHEGRAVRQIVTM